MKNQPGKCYYPSKMQNSILTKLVEMWAIKSPLWNVITTLVEFKKRCGVTVLQMMLSNLSMICEQEMWGAESLVRWQPEAVIVPSC